MILGFASFFVLYAPRSHALEARNSSSEVQGELRVIAGDGSSFQNQVNRPHQAADSAILQADRIEQSFLDQYKNDSDLIVGTYNYGLLMGLSLTKQQAEIIRNGAIPILGEPGESPIVNKNPRTGAEYVEIDGGSGDRSIAACYNPYVPHTGRRRRAWRSGNKFFNPIMFII